MANSFTAEFVMKFRDLASPGLKSLNSEFDLQKQKIREIRQEEKLRATEQRQRIQLQDTKLKFETVQSNKQKLNTAELKQFRDPSDRNLTAELKAKDSLLKSELSLQRARERQIQLGNQFKIQSEQNSLIQNKGVNSLVTSMFEGVTAASLLANTITGGVGLALQGIINLANTFGEVFQKQFQSAMQVETNIISGTTALSREFKLDRPAAKQLTVDTQKQIAVLGRDLPIESKQISEALTVFQNAGGLKFTGGDQKLFKEQILGSKNSAGLITRATLLREQLGGTVNEDQYQRSLGSLNPDASLSELRRHEFFRVSGLIDQLKGTGYDEADAKTRLKLLNKAMADLMPQDAIDELQGTAKATFSRIKDVLFDDYTGVFGFMRDLDLGTDGDQTMFQESKRTIDLIFGDNGLIQQFGDIVGFDANGVLKDVYSSLQAFNNILESVNNSLKIFEPTPEKKIYDTELKTKLQADPANANNSGIEDFIQELFGNIAYGLGIEKAKQLRDLGKVESRFNGTWLTASSGLSAAFRTESRNMPPGAYPVVANSAEDILPPGKLQRLFTGAYNSGRNDNYLPNRTEIANKYENVISKNETVNNQGTRIVKIEPGAIAIYQQPGQTSDDLAVMIVEKLSEMLGTAEKTMYNFG